MLPEARILAYDSLVDLRQRHEVTAPAGTSVAEMVALAFPAIGGGLRSMLRVTIGDSVVPEHLWPHVRPKPGTTVLVRPIPGNDVLRNVLTIAVTVAAIAAGQFYAPALLSTIGVAATTTSTAIASAAITATTLLAGTLLLNALVPTQRDAKDRPTYAIQGIKNQLTPDGVVPAVLGRIRQAPVYACLPYTEVVGDDHYIVAAFLHGYGPLDLTNFKIGDTPVERFLGVQFETRAGRPDDPPLSILTRTVIETQYQIELKGTGPYGGPQSRFTAADVTECSVDITFPGGLVAFAKDGTKKLATVNILIEYRLEGASTWTTAAAVPIAAKVQKSISRSFPITFPARGRYEIRMTRATRDWDDEDQSKRDTQYTARSFWTVMRSIRPEYPLAFDQPMALSAVRILASGQLNGTLDEWNSIDGSLLPDWDAPTGQWVERVTPNPASHFRAVLTGAAISYPLTLDEVDLAALQDWHEFCAAKGLTYNRVHNYEASVIDVLSGIAAAGRASPHDTGTKWGVVIDRALSQITQHISPRNSWGFQGERPYSRFPDAFRVSFLDETNNWAQAERVVPWPGHVGDIDVTEKIEMPGVTNPDMIWRETRRRQYELIHRPDTYTVNQDWEGLAAGRGDRVQLSHDVLDRIMVAARVVSVSGATVFLDEPVTMIGGQSYAARFRRADGTSLLRTVQTIPGEHNYLMLTGVGDVPSGPSDASASGDLAFFGPASRESFACTVKGLEAMENFTSRLTLIDHAPEIEALVDAEVPPPWNGRVGADIGQATVAPAAPRVTGIVSGRLASTSITEDNPYPVVVSLQPGDTVPIASYEVQHRLISTMAWSSSTADAASGAVLLAGYAKGQELEAMARGISTAGVAGAWSPVLTHVVAATDPPPLAAPYNLSATSPNVGQIRVQVTSGPNPETVGTQILIGPAGAPFASAAKAGDPIPSGPNVTLPPLFFSALGNGDPLMSGTTYRVWAIALDALDGSSTSSIPAGPAEVTVS